MSERRAKYTATPHVGRLFKITEKQFAQQVVDYGRLTGWLVYRTWNSIHSPAGFPDCVFVLPATTGSAWLDEPGWYSPRLLVAEIKVGKGQPTAEQCEWLEAMQMAGVPAYLWTPDDWDEIQRVLGRGNALLADGHVTRGREMTGGQHGD